MKELELVKQQALKMFNKKGLLASSCCPSFVDYVKKQFPKILGNVSENLSPMAEIARCIKEKTPDCKIIFIGPCTAKKMEFQDPSVRPYIDGVITFEELQALFDSKDIDITQLPDDVLDNASYYGRIFARSGGLSDAVRQGLKERGENGEDGESGGFELKAVVCDGIEACRTALLQLSKNVLPGNFI
ncbi:MAG: hypothetical protein LBQ40_02675 [Clostridiales bacterium]|jgi:iron only hydrogenase large subunit-like protein|nr:hypothetical protein [Clostridiales bacterium]